MAEAAVQLERVSYTYPGAAVSAVDRVSLRVEEGERLGILGPNGGGKSTLLRLVLGQLSPQEGSVRVCGMEPAEARRRGLIGSVAQRAECELAFPLSVRQVVTMGAAWRVPAWRGVPRAVRERVTGLLDLVGASAYAWKPVGRLSGGQLQRVLIARALAPEPRVLILDEPTVGIDAEGQRRFADLLARVHERTGVTMIIVSHDLRAIAAGSDRVACLRRTLHRHVTPEGLTPEVLGELFSHDVEGVMGDVHVHAHLAAECDLPAPAGHTARRAVPPGGVDCGAGDCGCATPVHRHASDKGE